jgi:hypothetical protein
MFAAAAIVAGLAGAACRVLLTVVDWIVHEAR